MKASRKPPEAPPSKPAPAVTRRHHAGRVLALWILLLAAYSNSFQAGMVFDNSRIILQDARIHAVTAENLRRLATETYSKTSSGLYRPLTTLSYLFNYAVLGDGPRPAGYHWLNFAIHALNVALVYLLGVAIFETSLWAWAAAALWGVHPLLTESVTNIVGRADLLAAFGILAGLLCYIRATSAVGRRRLAWFAGMLAAQCVGLLSKENAVILPGILLLYDLTWRRRDPWRERILPYGMLVLAIAAFFAWRSHLDLQVSASNTDNPLLSAGFLAARLTAIKVIGKYLWLFVWPASLSPDYSYNAVPVFSWRLSGWEDAQTLVALAVCAACALAAWRCRVQYKAAFFFLGFFFVALLPTANLLVLIGSVMAERFVYLPAIGLAGILAAAQSAFGRRLRPVVAGAIVGSLCLACAARTYARNFDWQDERSLWTSAVSAVPQSAKAHYNLGTVLSAVPGQLTEAIAEFQTALRINPQQAEAHDNLGQALARVPGRQSEAIAEFQAALAIDSGIAEAHNNLGNAVSELPGRLPDAVAEFTAAIRLRPDFVEAHANLGGALAQMPGRLPDALGEFETALRLNPNLAPVHARLGTILCQLPGRLSDGIAELTEAVRLEPDYAQAHNNLGIALAQAPGRLPDALAQFEAALRLNPELAEAHVNRGSALLEMPGHATEAAAEFRAALRTEPDNARARAGLDAALAGMPNGRR